MPKSVKGSQYNSVAANFLASSPLDLSDLDSDKENRHKLRDF